MGRTGLLVDLDGGLVGVDSNDLSNEVVVAHTDLLLSMSGCAKADRVTYKFVHGHSNHVLGHNDGTVVISTRSGRCDAVTYPETENTVPKRTSAMDPWCCEDSFGDQDIPCSFSGVSSAFFCDFCRPTISCLRSNGPFTQRSLRAASLLLSSFFPPRRCLPAELCAAGAAECRLAAVISEGLQAAARRRAQRRPRERAGSDRRKRRAGRYSSSG